MGENSAIQWTHHTFNPWIGCARVSPGCDHCYAERSSRRLGAQHGLALWSGDRFRTGVEYWRQPERWNRRAEKAGERHRVFCASFADVFEDRPDLVQRRADLLKLISRTPSLDWLLLTKRPENMVRMTLDTWGDFWPGNAWAGTTCEDQARAEERIPHLLGVPADVRFVSYEPALGPVDFTRLRDDEVGASWNAIGSGLLHWVIVGGESGPSARPFDPAWARSVVRQVREQRGVSVFVKQFGSNVLGGGIAAKKGDDLAEWPEALRVREFPAGRT